MTNTFARFKPAWWQIFALISYYALVLTLLLNSLVMTTGLGITTLVIWLLQAFPLIVFAPALHRNKQRAFAWLSFVTLMYFVHAVLVAFDPRRTIVGLLEIAACCALFTALIFYLRNTAETRAENHH